MAKSVKSKVPAKVSPSLKMVAFQQGDVKAALAAAGVKKTGKLLLVHPDNIHIMPGFNLRLDTPEYRAGIEELKHSILMEGYYDSKPLSCTVAVIDGESKIVVVDGHRRFEAVRQAILEGADIETLPVVLKPADVSDLELAVALRKENEGVHMTILENGVLAKRLMSAGMDEDQIAERLQVSARHVRDLKLLMAKETPKAVRDLVRDGKISGTEAINRLRKDPTGASIIEAAEKAEARAQQAGEPKEVRLTKQTRDDTDGTPKIKMTTHKLNFTAKNGSAFLFEDVEPFIASLNSVLGDGTWMKPARKKAERIALSDFEIEVKIRCPADVAVDETPAPAEKPAKGRKAAAAPPPVDSGDDGFDDDGFDDDDEPVDLRAAGIAVPIDDGM